MGGSASASKVQVSIGDSPGGGGLKSIITEPLEPHVSAEKFWELYEVECRAGAKNAIPTMGSFTGAGVKRHEEKDVEGGGFQVEDELSGGLFGPSDIPVVRSKHKFNKDAQEWLTYIYAGSWEEKDLELVSHLKAHTASGFSLELYSEVQPGRRQAGPDQLGVLQLLLKLTLTKANASNTAPALQADVDSPNGDGKVVLSESLGDSVDPETFWNLWKEVIKEGFDKKDKTDHKVDEMPNGGFLVTDTFVGDYKTYELYEFDKEKSMLTSFTYENDEKRDDQVCSEKYVMRLLSNPMRMEFWRESMPGRKCLRQAAEMLQQSIDRVLAAAEA